MGKCMTNLKKIHVICYLLLAVFGGSVFSLMPVAAETKTEPVVLDEATGTQYLGDHFAWYEDEGGELGLTEVIEKKIKWTASEQKTLNFGFTSSAYWFRFSVTNILDYTKEWYLT